MGSIVEHMAGLAQRLRDAGVTATHDPARAAVLRPCVLVTPPSIDYSLAENVYRLACLASAQAGTLAALAELDTLVQGLQLVPDVHPETADPVAYALSADLPAVPAYLVTITT